MEVVDAVETLLHSYSATSPKSTPGFKLFSDGDISSVRDDSCASPLGRDTEFGKAKLQWSAARSDLKRKTKELHEANAAFR